MSRRPISLHQLSMMELTPIELVRTASAAGFDRVCAFTCDTPGPDAQFPLITPGNADEMARVLKGEGISLHNIEIFFLAPDTDVAAYEAPLALGAKLGGTRTTAVIVDEDEARAAASLANFAELAGTLGIRAGLEFMAFTTVKTLGDAVRMIRSAGHPNLSVALDPLHLVRNGSTIADLRAVGPQIIGYVQFCDGPAEMSEEQRWDEAIANRMPPGEGVFPLRELLALIPADRCVSVEAPMERRRLAGQDALARARTLAAAARSFETVA